jgi:hypothetical protein
MRKSTVEARGRAMTVLAYLLDLSAEKEPCVKKCLKAVEADLNACEESTFWPLLQLACVLYAFKRYKDVLRVAEFARSRQIGKLSENWFHQQKPVLQKLFAIEARVLGEMDERDLARNALLLLQSMEINPGILSLYAIERLYESVQKRMTNRKEADWRIEMLGLLSLIIECGGSKSVGIEQAESEFQMHLSHLRAILKISQEQPPKRTGKNTAHYPIRSPLFAPDYVPGSDFPVRRYAFCSAGHLRPAVDEKSESNVCPECMSEPPKTEYDYESLATLRFIIWGDSYLPASASIETKWKCRDGHTWLASYNDVKTHRNAQCPECWRVSVLQHLNW